MYQPPFTVQPVSTAGIPSLRHRYNHSVVTTDKIEGVKRKEQWEGRMERECLSQCERCEEQEKERERENEVKDESERIRGGELLA